MKSPFSLSSREVQSLKLALILGLAVIGCRSTDNHHELKSLAPVADLESSPELKRAVVDFEARGGTGIWFTSRLHPRMGGQTRSFYLIKSLPKKADPEASIYLLRTVESLNYVQENAMARGALITLVDIPLETQVVAAVDIEAPLTTDVKKISGGDRELPVMTITPDATPVTFAHELQHWIDRANPTFVNELTKKLADFGSTNIKYDLFVEWFVMITLEMRGHATQAEFARNALAQHWPYLDRIGVVHIGELETHYSFEVSQADLFFNQTYFFTISAYTKDLSLDQKKALLKILKDYDFSENKQNKITFARFLGVSD